MRKSILLIGALLALITQWVISGPNPANPDRPQQAVYNGPPLPVSTGDEGYTPGGQTGVGVNDVSTLSVDGLMQSYTGMFPDPNWIASNYDDSVSTTPSDPTTETGAGDPPPPPPPPPSSDFGVCGIPGWNWPQYYGCGSQVFVTGRAASQRNCFSGATVRKHCP